MTGIYQIRNKHNNKKYIGKSSNIFNRLEKHIDDLINDRHCNKYIQKDFLKYGYNGFAFEIVDICKSEELNELESKYIKQLTTDNYNIIGLKNIERKHLKSNKTKFIKSIKINNPISEFIDSCCKIDNNSMISSRGLYNYYKNEWNLGGNKMSEKKFISMVKESYELETKIKRKNGKQLRCIIGIKCIDCGEYNKTINIAQPI